MTLENDIISSIVVGMHRCS